MKVKVSIILSIFAAWAFALSDYLLNMRNMYGPQFYSVFKGMSPGVVTYAAFSLFAFPFLAMGLTRIFNNSSLTPFVPVMKGFLSTVPVFIHASFIYYYLVVNHLGESGKELLAAFDRYKNPMGTLYFVGLIVLCLFLFIAIIRGKSSYPKAFAWVNPLVFVILLNILNLLAPAVAERIYPFMVPATILAVMMTVYLGYDLKKKI